MKKQGKKLLSILLTACMLANMSAVSVLAAEREQTSQPKTATASDAEKETQEETKEETKEEVKEETDFQNEVDHLTCDLELEEVVLEDLFPDLPDNEELFAGYVEQVLYGNSGIALYGSYGEDKLTGVTGAFYQKLKSIVAQIAAGTRTSTEIQLTLKELGVNQNSWTEEDLGVPLLQNGNFNKEALEKVQAIIIPDLNAALKYLQINCPYELYWYDKTIGVGMKSVEFSYSNGKIRVSNTLTFSMPVASAYQGGNIYTVNSTKAQAAQTAAAKADEIVKKYVSQSDNKKLESYKNEICNLVSYNDEAASAAKVLFGDPWQLIYVFDGDPDTKVVCEGYSKAFQYLCDLSDFEDSKVACYTVTGVMAGGTGAGGHMWNIVTMEDGKNYLVDVTNCDEGTVGEPDDLFLAGTDKGDVANGYTFTANGEEIQYRYDDDQEEMYGNILTIAKSSYKPKILPKLPTSLEVKAVYGQTLKDIMPKNPENGNYTPGIWNWQEPNASVGNAGTRTFKADFTPSDLDTFKPVQNQNITVIVSPKEVTPVITLESDSYSYTGQPIKPEVTVKDGGMVIPTSEYTVTYTDNTDIGTAVITVSNKDGGNYLLAETRKEFAITRADLSKAVLELALPEDGYVYDKTEKKPAVTVKLEGRTIEEGWYTVSYSENVNAGEQAKVTIACADETVCVGSTSTFFTIRKKTVTATASAENKIYDGQTSANVTVVLEGNPIINGDEVQITEVSGAFVDANPGEDKVVVVNAVLIGKDASNYEIKVQETRASIEAYDPKEVTEAISHAEEAKKDIQEINKEANAVTRGTRFVTTEELQALNNAIKKAKDAAARPLTEAESKAAAAELNQAAETFKAAIKTGTYRSSSGGSSGGGSGGGSGGSGGGASKGSASGSQSEGPVGTVTSDSRKGQVNSVTGVITGSTNGSAGDGYSHWQQGIAQDDSSWKLQYADGSYAAGTMMTDAAGNQYEQVAWEMIGGAWYAFGADANAKVGWVMDVQAGRWYFVDISIGMKMGWIINNGIWYYLNPDQSGISQRPLGAMYCNERTPDGYFVREDGSWDGGAKN